MAQSSSSDSGSDNGSRSSTPGGEARSATSAQQHESDLSTGIQEGKGRAAGALRDVAHSVRERAGNAPLPGVDRAAAAAVKPLENSAEYLDQHTPADMWSDMMTFCREHPAGALFLGFSLGYMVKKLLP